MSQIIHRTTAKDLPLKSLEELWQMYRPHLHGYDPDGEAELEAAFKSGAWTVFKMLKNTPISWHQGCAIDAEYEAFRAKRREGLN